MTEYLSPGAEYGMGRKSEVDLSNPKYKLVLMDFHGTIADRQLWSLRGMDAVWKLHFGMPAPKAAYYGALSRGGMSYNEYFQAILKEDERIPLAMKDEVRGQLIRTYNDVMRDIFLPMPGMRKALRVMLDAGIDIAVLTNGPETEKITRSLQAWRLPELAENFFNGPILQAKKPSPKALTKTIEYMALKTGVDYEPGHVLMVGDHFDDTEGATQSGVDSTLIIRRSQQQIVELKKPHPSYVIDDPRELLEIVAGDVPTLPAEDHNVVVYPPFFNAYHPEFQDDFA